MNVLFQKPRWATANLSVSAAALSATAIAISPTTTATVFLMPLSTITIAQIQTARVPQAPPPPLAGEVAPKAREGAHRTKARAFSTPPQTGEGADRVRYPVCGRLNPP